MNLRTLRPRGKFYIVLFKKPYTFQACKILLKDVCIRACAKVSLLTEEFLAKEVLLVGHQMKRADVLKGARLSQIEINCVPLAVAYCIGGKRMNVIFAFKS